MGMMTKRMMTISLNFWSVHSCSTLLLHQRCAKDWGARRCAYDSLVTGVLAVFVPLPCSARSAAAQHKAALDVQISYAGHSNEPPALVLTPCPKNVGYI